MVYQRVNWSLTFGAKFNELTDCISCTLTPHDQIAAQLDEIGTKIFDCVEKKVCSSDTASNVFEVVCCSEVCLCEREEAWFIVMYIFAFGLICPVNHTYYHVPKSPESSKILRNFNRFIQRGRRSFFSYRSRSRGYSDQI